MITPHTKLRRVLIPRWRPWTATAAVGVLAMPKRTELSRGSPELSERLASWTVKRDLITAAEAVETALIEAQESEVAQAARHLADSRSGATRLVREQALVVLRRTGELPNLERTYGDSRYWRSRTREEPRDALAWVELSLNQLNAGEGLKAERSMAIAIQLAPDNRHVLRSSARLYCHFHDPERAYALIRRSARTPHDPWLMAAEIALAQLNGKAPKFLKKGLNGLADGLWAERQITELAGAAATMFLSDGSTKKSKRLFSASMIDPTANSLAQAEWASQAINESFVPEAKLKDFAKEAVHLHAFEAGKFRDALTAARDWIEEEPFSMRAHVAAVSAAMLADEYELTVELAVAGKKHAPHSLALGNAEAFGLARCGRLDEAEAALRPVLHRSKGEQVHMSVAKANGALVAMRRGNLAIGENMYRQVIDEFAARGELSMKCSAAAYFAQEAIQARHPQAREILAEADQMIRDAKTKRPGFKDPISEQALKTANSLANSHLAANN